MANVFDYIFNIGGNYTATINGMSSATGDFQAQIDGVQSKLGKFTTVLAGVDLVKNALDGLSQATEAMSSSGIKLDSQMHDLSAVARVTGAGFKQIETFARESAEAFGTDASVAVEGYKLLLSQLSPELGKYPEALRSMGDCIQTTSKLMGGDGVAAAQVLTTAMNQYGVSLEDPTAASEEMARMMNVMAAAGQAGSAELPAISAALQQCGMAAKAANVSFEETNAAIQVLDKAGKKASEGGVALRNVLGQLSKGRFVEKQAAEELQKATAQNIYYINEISKELSEYYPSYNYDLGSVFNAWNTVNVKNENIQHNICFYSFKGGSNVVKYETTEFFNFATSLYEISNVMENTEVLNSLEFPNYSTNLYQSLINNSYKQLNIEGDKNYNISNNYEQPDLGLSNIISENNPVQIITYNTPRIENEKKLIMQPEIEREEIKFEKEEIENIVMGMFRREVELCSY